MALRLFLVLFAVVLALAATGCPGELEDPDRFGCSLDVEQDIFVGSCGSSSCHGASVPAGGLDLVAAGVAARLVGKPPTCEKCSPSQCDGKLLIDPKNPDQSYLLEKVHVSNPACGARMPVGAKLSSEQLACLEKWVSKLAASAGTGGGGGTGGSGGTDGGSGGSTDAAAGSAGAGDGG
jgi:hypothetical protein